MMRPIHPQSQEQTVAHSSLAGARLRSLRKVVLWACVVALCGVMHGQAPTITGTGPSCDAWPGYFDGEQYSYGQLICGQNFINPMTITVARQADWGGFVATIFPTSDTQAFFQTGDGPPSGYSQAPSDLTICNASGCTVYHNGLRWSTGSIPEPDLLSPDTPDINALGGDVLGIVGNYLNTATWATICDQNASIGSNGSSVTVPAYAGGPIVCTLVMGNDAGSDYLAEQLHYYGYNAPGIASVSPSAGPASGGTVVTITGTLFGTGDTVTIGGVAATNVTITGHNVITATVPASISGSGGVTVSVTGPNGTGSAANGFVYGSHNGVFVADLSAGIGSLNADGTTQSSATSGGGNGLAVGQSGFVWSIDATGTGLSRFSNAGVLANDYTGLSLLNGASALATDGNGLIWVANSGTNSVVAVNSSGAVQTTGVLGSDVIGATPSAIAVDEAGGVWVASKAGNSVTHIIGAAAPVVTPIANGVANNTLGKKPE